VYKRRNYGSRIVVALAQAKQAPFRNIHFDPLEKIFPLPESTTETTETGFGGFGGS